METVKNKILQGNALTVLDTLPPEIVNMCMTSPPYYQLRDYKVKNQIGREKTYQEYIENLCLVFDKVKRVLRKDGTLWVNIADTYAGSGNGMGDNNKTGKRKEIFNHDGQKAGKSNIPNKSLMLIPFRFAIAMVERKWILRNTIIWKKDNCMPSSADDRFTNDYEYLFFFSKNKNYYFEQQFDGKKESSFERYKYKRNGPNNKVKTGEYAIQDVNFSDGEKNSTDRNMRTTWNITTAAATWEYCKNCNTYYDGEKLRTIKIVKEGDKEKKQCYSCKRTDGWVSHFAIYPQKLCRTPIRAGCPKNGIVLDPFSGSGTTSKEALMQGKYFINVELNEDYINVQKKRLELLLQNHKLEF
jgi:site-specific DNA-methyltransferase (adenine-specific)